MARLRTDNPTSRRIVRAFLDFLHSVDPAPGVDHEGLEVAKDCLTEVFGLHQLPETEQPEPNLLLNIFSSENESPETEPKTSHNEEAQTGPSTQNSATGDLPGTSKVKGDVGVEENNGTGLSKDEIFGQFFDALEKIRFFRITSSGDDDHVLLDRATCLFHDAVNEIERSGCTILNRKNLADALKVLGNKAMESNYADAIERYTCAIALFENAVYYCNRAAAYTQMHKYDEAIKDCLKAIEIDPNYGKAYSRLGLAYYAQGKYSDAINKGFRKALELDPNNDAVKENIRVAEQKLNEEQEQRRGNQDSRNHYSGTSGNQSAPHPFASFSFDPSTIPANFASMFSNMAGSESHNQNGQGRPAGNQETHIPFVSSTNAIPADIASMFMNTTGNGTFQGQGAQSEQNGENGAHPFSNFASMFMNMAGNGSQGQNTQGQPQGRNNARDDPGIGLGGGTSFSFNFNDVAPEELNRTVRSMMGMFSREPQGDQQNNNGDGRSASR
ncbi:small glutamine-rich tetratricopeptide repeat-containing protein 2 isoform X1 [Amaranthus tricolor]|uniref:small glutamine-rich tetratricopeptide repeat-containing protein 2 isoform X1 n=1 Tax=Amaranthus tricolor TaxID=29722 RepID=UPI002589BB1D|nr:small glutamine-rich tetratricopeptide repeat-containing protein 2 isoform X1 [Amaranthus tricolor]